MLGDTIQAVASPRGSAPRGVLRVSGPCAFAAVASILDRPVPRRRSAFEARLRVCAPSIETLILAMPGPASFTGEDVVEVHLPGSPLLMQMVGASLAPLVRPALPGEFTRRAFQNGRLDLVQAEAVLALIAAHSEEDRRRASRLLDGGLGAGVADLRRLLLDLRAVLESGLDFEASETGAIRCADWMPLAEQAFERLAALRRELPRTIPGGDLLLIGRANAGKSSLVNALAGRDAVIVAPTAGTTRDVIAVELAGGLRVLDAPGDLEVPEDLDRQALALRDRISGGVAAAILVVDPRDRMGLPDALGLPVAAIVSTRADLDVDVGDLRAAAGTVPLFAVGCPIGRGIEALARFLDRLPRGPEGGCRHAVDVLLTVEDDLTRMREQGLAGAPELAAVDLGAAVDRLGALDGVGVDDAVLDRIFARFCLGK